MRTTWARLVPAVLLLAALSSPPLRALEPAAEEPKDGRKEWRYQLAVVGERYFVFDRHSGLARPLEVPGEKEAKVSAGRTEDGAKAWRYEMLDVDGKPHSFDRQTGQLTALAGGAGGAPHTPPVILPDAGPPEVLVLPLRNQAPAVLTDTHRRNAEPDIEAYKAQLGLIQTVRSEGSRLTGTISATNRGARKLAALELTLLVPAGADGEFEQHRFVMGYGPGQKRPPAPGTEAQKGPVTVFLPVDVPAPALGGKGRVSLKITYLQFAGE